MNHSYHNSVFLLLLTMLYFEGIHSQYVLMQHVLQWPPTFCQEKVCKPNLSERFSIHGLWPADSLRSMHCKCSNKPSERNKVNALMRQNPNLNNQLKIIWPNLIAGVSDVQFWQYEWIQHGYCNQNIIPMIQYFQVAVRVSKMMTNLIDYMDVPGGVHPSNHTSYSESHIRQSIFNLVGPNIDVFLSCMINSTGHVLLKEVYLCLDRSVTHFITCPGPIKSKLCGVNNIFLPTF
uniref:Putative ovule protein n=1 Tax=Solanum chacoense TaxID=4108 RepID=A0A0V0HCY1_SOLCH